MDRRVLAIYGAGGQGRHTLDLALQINAHTGRWGEIVFIDDFVADDGMEVNGHSAYPLNTLLDRYDRGALEAVVSLGEPAARRSLRTKLCDAGVSLATLVHPGVYLSPTVELGEGTIVCQGSIIDCNAVIGKNCYISTLISVGHDCRIGNDCFIATGSKVAGHTKLAERVYIGQNSTIKESLTIGADTIVSQAAAVFKDVDEGLIVVGNPARASRRNESKRVFS